jgi:hypothetical protein
MRGEKREGEREGENARERRERGGEKASKRAIGRVCMRAPAQPFCQAAIGFSPLAE